MNKSGQAIFVFMMVAIIIFIAAISFIPALTGSITTATSAANLNCTNPDISIYTQATCTIVDTAFFYFISVCIAVGLALISGRKTITSALTAIVVYIVVAILITPLKELVILARSATYLNCTSAAISVGSKMTCIFVDLWLFYFVILSISVAISYIFIRGQPPQ